MERRTTLPEMFNDLVEPFTTVDVDTLLNHPSPLGGSSYAEWPCPHGKVTLTSVVRQTFMGALLKSLSDFPDLRRRVFAEGVDASTATVMDFEEMLYGMVAREPSLVEAHYISLLDAVVTLVRLAADLRPLITVDHVDRSEGTKMLPVHVSDVRLRSLEQLKVDHEGLRLPAAPSGLEAFARPDFIVRGLVNYQTTVTYCPTWEAAFIGVVSSLPWHPAWKVPDVERALVFRLSLSFP